MLVFKLGAKAELPVVETMEQVLPEPGLEAASAERIEQGRALYNLYCAVCHGGNAISAGMLADPSYNFV